MRKPFNVIDLTYLSSIADGNDDIVKELVEIFVDQLPEFTEGLKESLEQKDWNRMAGLAHKAKSSVVSMGMTDVGNIELKNLELLSKNRRITYLKQLPSIAEKDAKELDTLLKNIESYPEEKQQWVLENDQDDTITEIIDKFVATCNIAKEELKSIIGA